MGEKRDFNGVRAASESTIEIDFYYAGRRCRERVKLKPTAANLRRAAQHRAAILHAIETGEFDYATTFPNSKNAAKYTKARAGGKTVTEYMEAWLGRKKPTLKSSTSYNYGKIVNGHIIPAFGKRELADITRIEIKEWAAGLESGNKTISNVLSVFRAALQEAFEDEVIPSNPLAGWTYRKAESPTEHSDVDPFSAEEQAAIIGVLDGQGKALIQFAFWSGLRTSELIALNWGDVDWIKETIHVRRALTNAARKTGPETTKTRAGTRMVKLLPPAMAALKQQKLFTFLKNEEIFQDPRTLARWGGDQPIRKGLWIFALKKAGVRYRYPYQTRHTYASMMLSAGENPMWVAQQMGHSDWGMIRRVYGKWMPDENQQSGGMAVNRFWSPNADQKADHAALDNPEMHKKQTT